MNAIFQIMNNRYNSIYFSIVLVNLRMKSRSHLQMQTANLHKFHKRKADHKTTVC